MGHCIPLILFLFRITLLVIARLAMSIGPCIGVINKNFAPAEQERVFSYCDRLKTVTSHESNHYYDTYNFQFSKTNFSVVVSYVQTPDGSFYRKYILCLRTRMHLHLHRFIYSSFLFFYLKIIFNYKRYFIPH